MGSIILRANGIVKFYAEDKNFGFITTKQGDVRIAGNVVGAFASQLVKNAEVDVSFVHQEHRGRSGYNATRIHSVIAPKVKPKPVELLAVVDWFDPAKGFGFVEMLESPFDKPTAFLHVGVCEKMSFLPVSGDKLIAMVEKQSNGRLKVLSFKQGPDVDSAVEAKLAELHAEDGAEVVLETAGSVDELMAAHTAETQAAIGQTSAVLEAVETEVEAAPAPKAAKQKQKRAPKKPSAKKAAAVSVVEAIQEGLLDNAPEGSMAAQLAALGLNGSKPNGAVAH